MQERFRVDCDRKEGTSVGSVVEIVVEIIVLGGLVILVAETVLKDRRLVGARDRETSELIESNRQESGKSTHFMDGSLESASLDVRLRS